VPLHELDEDAARRFGMEERDAVPPGSGPGRLVDESDALRPEASEVALQVLRAIRDVVQGRAAALEEPPHGGLRAERLQELDGADEGDAYALGFQGLGRGTRLAGQEFVERATLFDGVDGDGHVIDGPDRLRDVGHRRMLHSVPKGDKEKWNADE
jgi:hypothetical protein